MSEAQGESRRETDEHATLALQISAKLSGRERLVIMLLYAEQLTVVETSVVLAIEPREVRRIEADVIRQVESQLGRRPK